MKNTSPLQFTEHHRFFVYRDFMMSPLERRMLSEVYQPMVGHGALAFYNTLYQQIDGERIGYSAGEQQRSLFYSMGIELNEQGRRILIQYSSQLEALGLLQTVRRCLPKQDEWIYVYQLQAPLHPRAFFMHLQYPFLLRDCLGQHAYQSLQAKWKVEMPEILSDPSATQENVSVLFEERFRISEPSATEDSSNAVRMTMDGPVQFVKTSNVHANVFSLQDLLMRTPRTSSRRAFIQRLENHPDVLAAINYIALKHELSLSTVCRLLDEEDGVFDTQGRFSHEQLERAARECRQHQQQREEKVSKQVGKLNKANLALVQSASETESADQVDPQITALVTRLGIPMMLDGKLTIAEYASKIQGLPFTQFIKLFLGDQPIPQRILALLERVNYYYGIRDEVINVLTHFMYTNGLPWNENFVEKTTNEWLMSRMTDFADAVLFFERKTNQLRQQIDKQSAQGSNAQSKDQRAASSATQPPRNTTSNNNAKRNTTNVRPQMNVASAEPDVAISAEKLEEIRRKARDYEDQRKKEGG